MNLTWRVPTGPSGFQRSNFPIIGRPSCFFHSYHSWDWKGSLKRKRWVLFGVRKKVRKHGPQRMVPSNGNSGLEMVPLNFGGFDKLRACWNGHSKILVQHWLKARGSRCSISRDFRGTSCRSMCPFPSYLDLVQANQWQNDNRFSRTSLPMKVDMAGLASAAIAPWVLYCSSAWYLLRSRHEWGGYTFVHKKQIRQNWSNQIWPHPQLGLWRKRSFGIWEVWAFLLHPLLYLDGMSFLCSWTWSWRMTRHYLAWLQKLFPSQLRQYS